MKQDDKIREMEKLLKELKAQNEESAATIVEDSPRRGGLNLWRMPLFLSRFKFKTILLISVLAFLLIAALPFAAFWAIQGSTFT